MYENAHIQTVAEDFSRRREQEPSILSSFVRLNLLQQSVTVSAEVIQSALC